MTTVAFDMNDYWGYVFARNRFPNNSNGSGLTGVAIALGIDMSSLPHGSGTGVDGPFTYVNWSAFTPSDVQRLTIQVADVVKKQMESGLFTTEIGPAEDTLPKYKKVADLLISTYGADFYSEKKVLLIDAYYEALRFAGRAIMRLRAGDGTGPENIVRLKRGGTMPLENYLARIFPRVFQLYQVNSGTTAPNILVMDKSPDLSSLLLQKRLRILSVRYRTHQGMTFPSVELEEI